MSNLFWSNLEKMLEVENISMSWEAEEEEGEGGLKPFHATPIGYCTLVWLGYCIEPTHHLTLSSRKVERLLNQRVGVVTAKGYFTKARGQVLGDCADLPMLLPAQGNVLI